MLNAILLTTAVLSGPSIKVKVDGEGYMRFIRDGRAVYAKRCVLEVIDGKLADAQGDLVLPTISVPSTATGLSVDLQGTVTANVGGNKIVFGQLVLAGFAPTVALEPDGAVYIAGDRPHLGNPGDESFGVIRIVNDDEDPRTAVKGIEAQQPTFVIPPSVEAKITHRTVATSQVSPAIQKPTVLDTRTWNRDSGKVQITVQEHSVVPGDEIALTDIAVFDGDPALIKQLSKVDLGETPPTGIKRLIDRSRILVRIRAAGLNPDDFSVIVPAGADIRRKGQTIPNAQFTTTAVLGLMQRGGMAGAWECTDNFSDLEVPSGKVELRTDSVSGQETADASVVVGIYLDGVRWNGRTVHLHMKNYIPPLRAGSAIKVILIAGHAQVEVPGIARSSGRLGEAIQVEVTTGNPPVTTRHTGVLTAAGIVEVKL